jgi:raffinose/stachyose/melibiose transport system substrate-binding protein
MNSIDRRTFLRGATLAALAAGLPLARTSSARAAASLTIWSDITDAAAKRYFLDQFIAPFQKQNEGEEVKVVFRDPNNLDRQIRLALQAGQGPDVISTNGPAFVPELANAGLLLDMAAYDKTYSWHDKLLPWAFDLGLIGDKLYAIPTQFETLGIYFNRKVFAERGYSLPTNRKELEAIAEDLKKDGLKPFAAGSADNRQTIEWYTSVFFSHYAGPEVMYEVLTGKRPWTDADVVGAVELMRDYFNRGYFGGSVEEYFATGFDSVHTQLAESKAAMNMEGTWFFETAGEFLKSEDDWDFGPFPTLRDGQPYPIYAIGCGGTISINAAAAAPDLGAKYIDHMIGDTAAAGQRIADQSSVFALPLRFKEGDLPARMNPKYRRTLLSLVEATTAGNVGYTNWTFPPPKTANYIYTAAEKVLVNELKPADYCAAIQDVFEQELAGGFQPRVINPAARG